MSWPGICRFVSVSERPSALGGKVTRGRMQPVTSAMKFGSEHQLHHRDVEPSVELPTDLAFDPYELEAAGFVKRSRCGAGGFDAPDHRMESRVAGNFDQMGHQESPDSTAGEFTPDINRVFDGGSIGRPLLVRRQRGEPDDLPIRAVHGHDCRERSGAFGQPVPLGFQ